MFYIYHMIARTPGTKVQINFVRSTWCDVERVTACGIVVLASTVCRRPRRTTGFESLRLLLGTRP